ncbi:hypothetical protein Y032_0044g967 [Ancylostoma ceylanicum]|uniref:Uncharacterized protein n=1 Tax=Ancylostoma ceylanicum TaxID=53326 RepID=A0A016UEP5_9BILA|nr:hypothetical protein Y032_0044g967 [Ancylostoma ceylanicum]
MISLLSFPSHSGLSPGKSAIFRKRAEVVASRTVFLAGFVKVDQYVCLHCGAEPRNSAKSVKAKFPERVKKIPKRFCSRDAKIPHAQSVYHFEKNCTRTHEEDCDRFDHSCSSARINYVRG